MYTRTRFALVLSVLVAAVLAGCSGAATPAPAPTAAHAAIAPTRAAEATNAPALQPTQAPEVVQWATATPAAEAAMVASPVPTAQGIEAGGDVALTVPERPNRLIVKNAEVKLLVADTDVAIDRVTQVAADVGGYIISSRVRYDEWLGKKYKYASITLGVPVDQFEVAMRRLRSIALRVVDETASGQDVTDEYVDLQSRLGNLEATRDRIRTFLDQAQTVEESLRVNEQLAAVEGEIEQVKGRKNYLFDRSSYSTITIQIDPDLPQPTPEPTPAPTMTPTPSPTPTPTPPWTPVETVQEAGSVLGSILRFVAQVTIWLLIVGVPVLAPVLVVLWAVQRWTGRRRKRQTD